MIQLIIAVGVLLIGGTLFAQDKAQNASGITGVLTATANLIDSEGADAGHAQIRQATKGIMLKLDLKNAMPGIHALHVHEVGRCDRPSFESAGSHFNPSSRQHGLLNDRGPHAGDLPNLNVPATRQLSVELFLADVSLEPGPQSLLDENGSALVIHSGADDHRSDPAGGSGDRLVCGQMVSSETR
jgi:superoxide dismutase, Cu-Zn family